MSAYCVLNMNRIKSGNMLKQSYEHHNRLSNPQNADKDLEALNDISIPVKSGDILKQWNERINNLEYYKDRKIPKNSVMAYDVLVSYSAEAAGQIDLEEWKADNIEWLKKTFGEENVLSVIFHYDEAANMETGVIHGHAIVIPIDDKGHLNATHYTGSKDKRSWLQDSYAMSMKKHGLERGIENPSQYHTERKRFYAELKDAAEKPIPQQLAGETDKDYIERLKEAMEQERQEQLAEINMRKQQIETEKEQKANNSIYEQVVTKKKKEVEDIVHENDELLHDFGSWNAVIDKANEMQALNNAIGNCEDTELKENITDQIWAIVDWVDNNEQRKEKQRKDKEQELNQ